MVSVAVLMFGAVSCGGSEVTEDISVPELNFAAALSAEQTTVITVDLSGSQTLPPVDTRRLFVHNYLSRDVIFFDLSELIDGVSDNAFLTRQVTTVEN